LEEILAVPTFVVKNPIKIDVIQFTPTGRKSFLYTKIDCSNHMDLRHLENLGFRVIEINVTLKQELGLKFKIGSNQNQQYRIRLAKADDRKDVEEIARKSFTLDRFHQDPRIDNSSADEIKKQWAGNFFLGKRGDLLAVATRNNRPVAFLLLLFGQKENIIDLIAVDSEHRKNGLAEQMIEFVKSIMESQKTLLVGTQATNIPSIRLYEKMGFQKIDSQILLHYHGPFESFNS
jgi:ribosomal protein S18 acetylase RimI-like enzyme